MLLSDEYSPQPELETSRGFEAYIFSVNYVAITVFMRRDLAKCFWEVSSLHYFPWFEAAKVIYSTIGSSSSMGAVSACKHRASINQKEDGARDQGAAVQ